jgi:hypothetical protein
MRVLPLLRTAARPSAGPSECFCSRFLTSVRNPPAALSGFVRSRSHSMKSPLLFWCTTHLPMSPLQTLNADMCIWPAQAAAVTNAPHRSICAPLLDDARMNVAIKLQIKCQPPSPPPARRISVTPPVRVGRFSLHHSPGQQPHRLFLLILKISAPYPLQANSC